MKHEPQAPPLWATFTMRTNAARTACVFFADVAAVLDDGPEGCTLAVAARQLQVYEPYAETVEAWLAARAWQ